MVVSEQSVRKKPIVSVVIPNYNHAKYLKKRIDSVLNQTFQDFELIILDDCSQDTSRDLIRSYVNKDKRIRAFFNENNSGSPFKQWNKGVSLARAEYIWIAESDDYADKNFLSTLLTHITSSEKVGLVYCQSHMIDENDNIMGNMKNWTDDLDKNRWAKDFKSSGINECKIYLSRKCTIPNASAVLFRKKYYLGSGMADENYKMCGDWLLWIKILSLSDIYFVSQSLNYFRFHGNTTRKYTKHSVVLNKIREEYEILKYLNKKFIFDKRFIEDLKKDIFKRSINFMPINLKFSLKFLDFIKIVKQTDDKVYYRIFLFVIKRLVTYIPEKITLIAKFNSQNK